MKDYLLISFRVHIWKFERDNYFLQKDNEKLSECLSSIFCLADLYNPDNDRKEYELDETQLRIKIGEVITGLDR